MKVHNIFLSILIITTLGFASCHKKTTKNSKDTATINNDISKIELSQQNMDENAPLVQNRKTMESSPSDCKIKVIKELKDNLNHLTERQVLKFLKCFNETCELNIEFSQAANYYLFVLLQHEPEMVLKLISENDHLLKKEYIYKNLKNPVNDEINIQLTYKKISEVSNYSKTKESLLAAISNNN